MDDVKGLCERLEAVRGLLSAQDDRQAKMHELLETIREQIRLGVPAEHRPDGLFKNIQDAVYGMRGRTPLLNDIAITSPFEEAATALQSLAKELAEARAERDAARETLRSNGVWDFPRDIQNLTVKLEAAEAASASKDERIAAAEKALEAYLIPPGLYETSTVFMRGQNHAAASVLPLLRARSTKEQP